MILKNKFTELLEKVDDLSSIEEVKKIESEIEEDYQKMLKYKKKEAKNKVENKKVESKPKEENKQKKYKYPFIIHLAGRNLETDHIFESDNEYTEEEIRTKMLEHQYYDFSGKVSFEYLEKENILLPIFQHHKKG